MRIKTVAGQRGVIASVHSNKGLWLFGARKKPLAMGEWNNGIARAMRDKKRHVDICDALAR